MLQEISRQTPGALSLPRSVALGSLWQVEHPQSRVNILNFFFSSGMARCHRWEIAHASLVAAKTLVMCLHESCVRAWILSQESSLCARRSLKLQNGPWCFQVLKAQWGTEWRCSVCTDILECPRRWRSMLGWWGGVPRGEQRDSGQSGHCMEVSQEQHPRR